MIDKDVIAQIDYLISGTLPSRFERKQIYIVIYDFAIPVIL